MMVRARSRSGSSEGGVGVYLAGLRKASMAGLVVNPRRKRVSVTRGCPATN